MRREDNLQSGHHVTGSRDALAEYLAALEEIYPSAKGTARVLTRDSTPSS